MDFKGSKGKWAQTVESKDLPESVAQKANPSHLSYLGLTSTHSNFTVEAPITDTL